MSETRVTWHMKTQGKLPINQFDPQILKLFFTLIGVVPQPDEDLTSYINNTKPYLTSIKQFMLNVWDGTLSKKERKHNLVDLSILLGKLPEEMCKAMNMDCPVELAGIEINFETMVLRLKCIKKT